MAEPSRREGIPSRAPLERAPGLVWSRVGLVSFWVLAFGLIATGVASSWEQIVGSARERSPPGTRSLSCPSCGESLLGGSERCPGCGAMVAPVVHGALAPDSRTLPARPRAEAPREIPGLRRREKNWQDEVRDRVRKRKKKRGEDPDLPLFESEPETSSAPGGRPPRRLVAPPVPESAPEPAPEPMRVARRRKWVAPAREERAPSFEGRILDRVDPLDSLTDLPLRTPEVAALPRRPDRGAATSSRNSRHLPKGVPNNSSEARVVTRGLLENSRHLPKEVPNNSSEARVVARGLLENSRHLPQEVPNNLSELGAGSAGVAQEFEAAPEGSAELSESDGWSVDAPLEPRLEPPPRLDDERPVERPAQALERAQAAAVDVVLLAALSSVVVYFASRFAHVPIDGLRPSWPYLASYLGFLALVYAVYFTGTTGQTLGKIVYGLRVVDTAGRPPGYLRAAGRAALGAVGVVLAGPRSRSRSLRPRAARLPRPRAPHEGHPGLSPGLSSQRRTPTS